MRSRMLKRCCCARSIQGQAAHRLRSDFRTDCGVVCSDQTATSSQRTPHSHQRRLDRSRLHGTRGDVAQPGFALCGDRRAAKASGHSKPVAPRPTPSHILFVVGSEMGIGFLFGGVAFYLGELLDRPRGEQRHRPMGRHRSGPSVEGVSGPLRRAC